MTSVDICNAALERLGVTSIASLADGTVEANACNLRYDWCRQQVIRAHIWKCAKKQSALTAVTLNAGPLVIGVTYVIGSLGTNGLFDATGVGASQNAVGQTFIATGTGIVWGDGFVYISPTFDYAYQVLLPADCVRVYRVNYNTATTTSAYLNERYRLFGRTIYIDNFNVNLTYISDLTDVPTMDASFRECVALLLATSICHKLTQDADLRKDTMSEYRKALGLARFQDATEEPAESIEAQEWIASRTGLFGGYVTDPLTPQ